jgi:hypothetical protein
MTLGETPKMIEAHVAKSYDPFGKGMTSSHHSRGALAARNHIEQRQKHAQMILRGASPP